MTSNLELLKKAKNVTNGVTDYLNNFRQKELNEVFCEAMSSEHRTLQQNFTSLCLAWVEHIGQQDTQFKNRNIDGRNEYSNKICGEIVNFMKENGINQNLPCI